MAGKFENPRGAVATKAKQKYNEKAYDRLYPMVHRGKKERYLAAEMSLNRWIETVLDRAADEAQNT